MTRFIPALFAVAALSLSACGEAGIASVSGDSDVRRLPANLRGDITVERLVRELRECSGSCSAQKKAVRDYFTFLGMSKSAVDAYIKSVKA